MEKFLGNLEAKFNKEIENFEKSPIKTTFKWVVIIFVVKKLWSWTKDSE